MIQQSHCWAYTPRKPELKETCVPPMFIAALFIIARTWKQPRCPSADEWIRKLLYIYTMEYYSAIKKKFDLKTQDFWDTLPDFKSCNSNSWAWWPSVQFSSVTQTELSCVRLFATPWIAARQASLSITNSRSSLRLTSIESVMPSGHLILCRPVLLPPIPPSIRVFSNESTLHMR